MTNFTGTEGVDLLIGGSDNDLINGLGGNDLIFGDEGNDLLNGGSGDDLIFGGDGNDTLLGGDGNDALTTFDGNSVLIGGDGNDTLITFNGDSLLIGAEGDDLLNGGSGDDTLIGGSGADLFGFFGGNKPFLNSNLGLDRIVDFESNTDKIALYQPTFTALTNTGGPINSNEFAIVANDIDAAANNAAIVYSTGSGNLFYNENGVDPGLGTGDQFATLLNLSPLSASDFIVGEALLNL